MNILRDVRFIIVFCLGCFKDAKMCPVNKSIDRRLIDSFPSYKLSHVFLWALNMYITTVFGNKPQYLEKQIRNGYLKVWAL